MSHDQGSAKSKKKRKVSAAGANGAAKAVAEGGLQQEPLQKLEGHIHCVSSVTWPQQGVIYTGGWDHSVRRYDVDTGINTDTYNGSKAVHAVAASAAGSNSIVAFGGADTVLRVWDPRATKGEALAVKAYAAHQRWISALAWRPGNEFQLASLSHDGAVKMWDIRTPVPLGTMKQHTDKGLCVCWWNEDKLVSGGADCTLNVYEITSAALPALN